MQRNLVASVMGMTGVGIFVFAATHVTWPGTQMPYGTFAYFFEDRLEMAFGAMLIAAAVLMRRRSD